MRNQENFTNCWRQRTDPFNGSPAVLSHKIKVYLYSNICHDNPFYLKGDKDDVYMMNIAQI